MKIIIDVRVVVVEVAILVKFPCSFFAKVEFVQIYAFAWMTFQLIDCVEEFVVANLALKPIVKCHWHVRASVAVWSIERLCLFEFNKCLLIPERFDSVATEAEIHGAFVGSLDGSGKLQGFETVYFLIVLGVIECILCSCQGSESSHLVSL